MNKENKSKNIVSILMVVALLFLCVGITYTALTYMKTSEDNTVKTGKISMSYSEPSNALELINALPMSDEEGLAQTNYFEFTVTSNASTNANDDVGVTIPYEVNISDIAIDTDKTILPKDKIKVAITRVVDGKEETIMTPVAISEMSTSVLREAASKVYEAKDVYKNNNGTITTRYRLRAWIDKEFELDNTKTYQYKFRVNVNSSVGVLEQPQPTFVETLIPTVVTTGDGLYATSETNDGTTSYYYKGAVTNNYVKLPEKSGDTTTDALYRIVRINEDGSVRLIRDQGINGNTTYQFNPSSNNYSYMYYSNSNVANGIMKVVNDWYAGAIEGTALDSKVVESSFCEQAKVKYSSSYTSGNAEMEIASKNYMPSLKCEEDGNGKGPLRMKVGLITADEVILAGIPLYYNGITSAEYNTNTYLQMSGSGWYFWTMSPTGFYSGYASVWYVNNYGYVYDNYVSSNYYRVRPVFSLSADVLMRGKGTETDPFTIDLN